MTEVCGVETADPERLTLPGWELLKYLLNLVFECLSVYHCVSGAPRGQMTLEPRVLEFYRWS